MSAALPAGITVFERGWLSSNNVLLTGADDEPAILVDTGYVTHGPQTLALVRQALAGRPLGRILNTHLHSDHCGGNALLQRELGAPVVIPPGEADAARAWDESRLSYRPTGQRCERFRVDQILHPGDLVRVGERTWQVLAAPGHDPHSVVLFAPDERILISADALWEHGFGVVFPEIENRPAFAEVRATLDLIATLKPVLVIPGHGAPFTDADAALERAYRRLDGYEAAPDRHGWYAGKVLAKFHLLEVQQQPLPELLDWLAHTPYFRRIHERYFADADYGAWSQRVVDELERAGAVEVRDGVVFNR